jgi:oligopeptide transport system substrate-binding protein
VLLRSPRKVQQAGRLRPAFHSWSILVLLSLISLICGACDDLEKPKSEPYYSGTTPPRKQEFRWSNGKLPKTLDPARAAAPSEADLVRAVYEGLTEIDAKTLKEKPAVAQNWTASEDLRNWTFHIRPNARWTNGKPVTADDFVRSWKRLGDIGDALPQRDLLKNIVGFPLPKKHLSAPSSDLIPNSKTPPTAEPIPDVNSSPSPPIANVNANANREPGPAPPVFGVRALDPSTLQVLLIAPDKDFPKLVAHPLFRPVFDAAEVVNKPPGTNVVTNGPFKITVVDDGGVTLEQSQSYWNRETIALEQVRLVASENAEQALNAYRAGEIDAVTNADFEPLALKLLEPFEDFRRRTHAAVNFYEINHEEAPFDDRRVREALAISIERERLTEGEMEGQAQPALSFLPFVSTDETKLVQDKERAKKLMEDAGFPNGKDFPIVSLVINRNDTQQRIARAVARMWKETLNVETEIVVKENAELEQARVAGDYDLIRRNVVFPTADELMSILLILKPPTASTVAAEPAKGTGVEALDPKDLIEKPQQSSTPVEAPDVTMSDANAIYELWAIPLYFPTSYSLVKPYVSGFEMNSLDAASLADVSINSDWQPK